MRMSAWTILFFAAASATVILLLLSVPLPDSGRGGIDPRTGERVETPWDRVAEARSFGEVRLSITRLTELVSLMPSEPLLASALTELRKELTPVPKPDAATKRWLGSFHGETRELVAKLRDLLDDRAIAASTERFYASDKQELTPNSGADLVANTMLDQLASEDHKPTDVELLDLTHAFRRSGRQRARLRWLLRAFDMFPDSDRIRDALTKAYLEIGHVAEAFAVTSVALPADEHSAAHWRQRAKIAAWLAKPEAEAEALERTLEFGESIETRKRLLDLYSFLGKPELAVPHGLRVAESAGELAAEERVAYLALRAGNVDRGLDILSRIRDGSKDPVKWRIKIADVAMQDYRFDRAIRELEAGWREKPSAVLEQKLESVYRRRGMPRKLADVLERRMYRTPFDRELRTELLSLLAGLGLHQRLRNVVVRLTDLDGRPAEFFKNLGQLDAAGVENLPDMTLDMADSTGLQPAVLGEIFESLTPFLGRPKFREAAEKLARRFADDPASKAFRVAMLDRETDPRQRALLARELAKSYPKDLEIAKVWVARASWSDDDDSQIQAREHLASMQPEDIDNRRELANLYEAVGEPDNAADQWTLIVAKTGVKSVAAQRLVMSLFASQRIEEALDILRERADDPTATVEDKVYVAEQLFASSHTDQAAIYFKSVLDKDPKHALALLRLGQIASWSNDPQRAIGFLEKRLAVSDAKREEVEYLLGEALWAISKQAEALPLFERSLVAMQHDDAPERQAMVARILTHLGRTREAKPIYAKLVEQLPYSLDLKLDYAEALLGIGEIEPAMALIAEVKKRSAHHRRVMRIESQLLAKSGKRREAIALLEELIKVHGPRAGALAELGQLQEDLGDWGLSRDSFRRWLQLQSESVAASLAHQRARDRLASRALMTTDSRRVGDDSALELQLHGSLQDDDERTRYDAAFGFGSYTGRAAVFKNAAADAEVRVALIDLGLSYRFGTANRVGAGLMAHPGADGFPFGLWVAADLVGEKPVYNVEARLHFGELLTTPAAAAPLGGRSHGLDLSGFLQLGGGLWTSASGRARALVLDPVGAPSEMDGHVAADVSLGYQLVKGDGATRAPYRTRHVPHESVGPFLAASPSHTRDVAVNTWVTLESARLLDDRKLASMIPIARRNDYLTGSVNLDKHVMRNTGVSMQGWLGLELHDSTTIWGVSGTATWRPSRDCELLAVFGIGKSLGRPDANDTSTRFQVQFTFRW